LSLLTSTVIALFLHAEHCSIKALKHISQYAVVVNCTVEVITLRYLLDTPNSKRASIFYH